MNIPVKIESHRSKSGGYWARVPAFAGCVSEGPTLEALMANIRDAIEGWGEAGNDDPARPDQDDEGPVEHLVL